MPSVAVPQFHFCSTRVCDQVPPVPRLRELPLQWRRATRTTRAALYSGTAAVVKISAGLDCEAVSPLGSVVMPESASFMPQTTA